MLCSNPTPKGTGLEIWGDCNDLQCLYDVMNRLSKLTPSENESTFERNGRLLTIVPYEIRHAFQGERLRKNNVDNGPDQKTTYYGFRIDWISIIFTLSALRYNSGHVPTDFSLQGWLYLLEHIVNNAMYKYDPVGAKMIEPLMDGEVDVSSKYVYLIHQHIYANFISMTPGKKRFRTIPMLLSDLGNIRSITRNIDTDLEKENCAVRELEYTFVIPNPIVW